MKSSSHDDPKRTSDAPRARRVAETAAWRLDAVTGASAGVGLSAELERAKRQLRYLTVRRAFASDAEMAEEFGVDRSRITRWKKGDAMDAAHRDHLYSLDAVVDLLSTFMLPSSISKWLRGFNAHLGNRRPLDVLRDGHLSEVIAAVEAERDGAFV